MAEHLAIATHFAKKMKAGESFNEDEAEAHLTARGGMLNAAMMGAIAFQKGLGVTHSCAHALSTVCDTHHGLANGVMLPAAMRFNLEAVPKRFLRMARVVNPGAQTGDEFITWIESLRVGIGIPNTLSDLEIPREKLDHLVAIAQQDGCHPLNPRPVSEADFYAIYHDALGHER